MKSVVIFSGGMDSFTLLNFMHRSLKKGELTALTFNYGQRHSKEIEYAKAATIELHVPHVIVDLTTLRELVGASALTGDTPVPEGHYEEPSMKQTVVPNRNMIMLSVAVGYAENIGARFVFYAAHAGDHAIYPDCRPEFVQNVSLAASQGTYNKVQIIAPYIHMTKGEIAALGATMGLDYAKTWTCYKGLSAPCGKCGACVERAEALEFAGL